MKKSNLNGWLSLAVSPFLLTYPGVRSLRETLIEMGKASEEIFRGDRLPILPLADTDDGDDPRKR
jgi:hypothetical protein